MTRSLILLFALALGACATTPPPAELPSEPPSQAQLQAWQQHRQLVNQITSWTLAGRIVVNTEDDGWNGELHWSQRVDGYGIQFSAPFGQGAFQIDSSDTGVEMRFSDGKIFQAADAESLLVEQLGWHLPLSGFQYWVTGVPKPESGSVLNYRLDGRLASLLQDKWRVTFPEYVTIDGMVMPRKIFLENHELSVRLVVDRWVLNRATEKGAWL
ncbi:MAG: outer membrane lipoprotein LolB [Gammaproteobacteria bacterium]|nr:outer membrane lipoprotein LolB [Gammaproteobacteria bacterium]